jgi:NAD+ synthase (glutamine-hydrolysing)
MMAYSNKAGSLLLATGNKSEFATGYCTLYGDMNGSLAVIGDLLKTEVYALARAMNRDREIIPKSILEKAPSAELRPDQQDTDSLPPYDLLDKILDLYLIENRTTEEIVADGYDRDTVERVLRMVGRAEYKRRQAAPVLKVSPRAFGTGRRMPIARRIYEAG